MTRACGESTFEEVLNELEVSLAWIEQLGIKIPSGSRYLVYRDRLRALDVHLNTNNARPPDEVMDEWYSALYEAKELETIRSGLGEKSRFPGLDQRVEVLIGGPPDISSEEEVSSDNEPRDVGFELVFASRLSIAGYSPALDERGDAVFSLRAQRVVGECKRPRRSTSIDRALRSAHRQALNDVGDLQAADNSGLLVIDLSYVLTPHSRLLNVAGTTLKEALDNRSRQVAINLNSQMRKLNLWNTRILGVAYRFGALIASDGIPNYVQQWGLILNAEEHTDSDRKRLGAELGEALKKANNPL